MKDKRVLLLVSTIVILTLMFFTAFVRDRQRNKKLTPSETTESKPVDAIIDEYADWTLFRNGYALPVPPKWKNTSDRGGTAVLEPGETVGNIQKISITVLSDEKATAGQRFTTQKELNDWSAIKGEVGGSIQKPKNIILD